MHYNWENCEIYDAGLKMDKNVRKRLIGNALPV